MALQHGHDQAVLDSAASSRGHARPASRTANGAGHLRPWQRQQPVQPAQHLRRECASPGWPCDPPLRSADRARGGRSCERVRHSAAGRATCRRDRSHAKVRDHQLAPHRLLRREHRRRRRPGRCRAARRCRRHCVARWPPRSRRRGVGQRHGADTDVLALNRSALGRLRCEAKLEVVPGATHLFEEPGTLESVVRLAQEWFLGHLVSVARRA